MLTYENVVTLLLGAAEQQRLNIIFSQEQMDTHALVRTFTMTCLPRGVREPDERHPRASISFRWDPALTAISIVGSEGLCDLYHTPDEPCPHTDMGCAYDTILELEAIYHVPLPDEQAQDFSSLVGLAAGTRELLMVAVGHEEDIEVRAQLIFDVHGPAVDRLEAVQRWMFDDELHETQALSESFGNACNEIADALEALAGREAPHPSTLSSDDDESDLGEHLTYLRPPTV